MTTRWLYLAVSFLLATLAALGFALRGASPTEPTAADAPIAIGDGEREPVADDELKGLWTRWPHNQAGHDKVRFYYFHGDGLGLYRYGRIGHTNTNSYRYRTTGEGRVELSFNKTGERYTVPFRVKMGRDGRRVLRLEKDPREGGAPHEYFYVPPPPELSMHTPLVEAAAAKPPSGRMWICMRRFATGGQGFELYQLTPSGIDGRGTGWHHRGDFDDWSTEAMTYRIENQRFELRFELTDEHFVTPWAISENADGARKLHLGEDPRNFLHASRFVDMGKSFSLDEPAALWRLSALAADGGLPTCR